MIQRKDANEACKKYEEFKKVVYKTNEELDAYGCYEDILSYKGALAFISKAIRCAVNNGRDSFVCPDIGALAENETARDYISAELKKNGFGCGWYLDHVSYEDTFEEKIEYKGEKIPRHRLMVSWE